MHYRLNTYFGFIIPCAALLLFPTMPSAAATADWSKIKGNDIMLFYPGQASWEWVLTDHSASKSVKKGTPCLECHKGEEKDMGALLVSGKKMEPTPIKDKPGSIKANVKFAHDQNHLYVHIEWPASNFHSGNKMDPDYADKIAVMFADGNIKEATIAGCWGACHDDATQMASAAPNDKRKLYLTASRAKLTRHGGGDNLVSESELAALQTKGQFMEYWQAKLNDGKAALASDGYVLEKRHRNDNPQVAAKAELKGGTWSVTLSRPLAASGPYRKSFTPGTTYYVGFALHDDYTEGRYHYLSFGRSLSLDQGDSDFIAPNI